MPARRNSRSHSAILDAANNPRGWESANPPHSEVHLGVEPHQHSPGSLFIQPSLPRRNCRSGENQLLPIGRCDLLIEITQSAVILRPQDRIAVNKFTGHLNLAALGRRNNAQHRVVLPLDAVAARLALETIARRQMDAWASLRKTIPAGRVAFLSPLLDSRSPWPSQQGLRCNRPMPENDRDRPARPPASSHKARERGAVMGRFEVNPAL